MDSAGMHRGMPQLKPPELKPWLQRKALGANGVGTLKDKAPLARHTDLDLKHTLALHMDNFDMHRT